MYMNIIYYHTLREVDRNKKYCIVLYCSRCLVNMTTVVNVVPIANFALLSAKYISGYYNL